MLPILATVLLAPLAFVIALPAVCDLWCFLARVTRRPEPLPESSGTEPIIFLVPAHNEAMLIRRCVRSLLAQRYPREHLMVAVVADNCTDDTAVAAREEGATVFERSSETDRGKGHAIAWALERLPLDRFAAVVIVDADTLVDDDYALHLSAWSPLEDRAIQSYDGMSNEFENWLTRMAGVLTRNRYGIALPLKVRAGLSVPLTGDGTVLGSKLLQRSPWSVATITEGWELYARYTLDGLQVLYEPRSKLYAQETKGLAQSRSQRERWTAGRLAVLRLYLPDILTRGRVSLLQRLDLVAELTNLGPIMRAAIGTAGAVGAGLAGLPGWPLLATLFASGVLQPGFYTVLSLTRHPQPWATVVAFLRLPLYAVWRVAVGIRAFALSGKTLWVRTSRHEEADRRT
jgi:cellulose synthase/poly-beta-1,6-N-acetylglucosamine synthase-like glycosyltransferase